MRCLGDWMTTGEMRLGGCVAEEVAENQRESEVQMKTKVNPEMHRTGKEFPGLILPCLEKNCVQSLQLYHSATWNVLLTFLF